MATRRETKDFRQEFLICSICRDPYDNKLEKVPKCLPCLHCFCVSCLRKIVAGRTEIQCPTCRKQCTVPDNGAEGFVTNFTVECLKDYQHLHEIERGARSEGQLCTNCDQGNSARGYCYDCDEYVCQHCTEAHEKSRIRLVRDHKITALTDGHAEAEVSRRLANEQFCKVHTTTRKALTLFCQTCMKPICEPCALTDHRGHDLVDLEGAVKQTKDNLKQLSSLVKDKKKPVENLSKLLDTKLEEMHALRMQQEDLINRAFDSLQAKLRKRLSESKEQLGQQCKAMEKALRGQKGDVDALLTQFHSAFDFADHTCRYANAVQLFEHRNMVRLYKQ